MLDGRRRTRSPLKTRGTPTPGEKVNDGAQMSLHAGSCADMGSWYNTVAQAASDSTTALDLMGHGARRSRESTWNSMTLLLGLAGGRIRGGDTVARQGTVALELIDFGAVARQLGCFVCRGRRRYMPLGRIGGHTLRRRP